MTVNLLLYTQIRWFSRGKVLSRLLELRDEVRLFILLSNIRFPHCFDNLSQLATLSYVAVVLSH